MLFFGPDHRLKCNYPKQIKYYKMLPFLSYYYVIATCVVFPNSDFSYIELHRLPEKWRKYAGLLDVRRLVGRMILRSKIRALPSYNENLEEKTCNFFKNIRE